MNMFLKQIIIKVFICGIICSLSLMLSGKGPLREPVRICCACLMVASVFSFFSKGVGRIGPVVSRYDLDADLKKGIESSETAIDEIAEAKLNKEIENRFENEKIPCSVKALFYEHKVVSITVICSDTYRERINNILAGEYGVEYCVVQRQLTVCNIK